MTTHWVNGFIDEDDVGQTFNSLLLAAEHQSLLQSFIIILGTFILEDAATVLAALRAEEGMIPIRYAVGALYIGIILGDMGLYGIGRLSLKTGWFKKWLPSERTMPAKQWMNDRLVSTVFISRFIPGLRLPTYLTCGYLALPFQRFAIAVTGATLIWTSLLFVISMTFGHYILDHMGKWRWAGVIGFAIAVIVILRSARRNYEVRS